MDEAEVIQSKPKLTEARHAALALLKASGITESPIKISDVFQHVKKTFDVSVMGASESAIGSKIDAVTSREGEEIFILYNRDRHVHRQRFSFAHELGHLFMGHVHGGSSIDLDSESFDEIEANQFAAYLLMPPTFLRTDIKAGNKDVAMLAAKYQVSDIAMWWQIDKAGLLKLL